MFEDEDDDSPPTDLVPSTTFKDGDIRFKRHFAQTAHSFVELSGQQPTNQQSSIPHRINSRSFSPEICAGSTKVKTEEGGEFDAEMDEETTTGCFSKGFSVQSVPLINSTMDNHFWGVQLFRQAQEAAKYYDLQYLVKTEENHPPYLHVDIVATATLSAQSRQAKRVASSSQMQQNRGADQARKDTKQTRLNIEGKRHRPSGIYARVLDTTLQTCLPAIKQEDPFDSTNLQDYIPFEDSVNHDIEEFVPFPSRTLLESGRMGRYIWREEMKKAKENLKRFPYALPPGFQPRSRGELIRMSINDLQTFLRSIPAMWLCSDDSRRWSKINGFMKWQAEALARKNRVLAERRKGN
jgi:hypothetical protein